MQNRPLRLGDILEVHTDAGRAYMQYVHHKKPFGSLVQILPGLHREKPTSFSELLQSQDSYYAFLPLEVLVNESMISIVGHEDIPTQSRKFPVMRKRGRVRPISEGGGTENWQIIEGDNSTKVTELSIDESHLSIIVIWPYPVLLKRLVAQWRPWFDVGASAEPKSVHADAVTSASTIKHYLYSASEIGARELQRDIASLPGCKIAIRRSANQKQWLITVTHPNNLDLSVSEYRRLLERYASEHGVEYDGWEASV